MRNQKGQVVLILILVMTVALAIGISVVQRSLSDISTSTKVEESSRAFSAAEAGIEKALNTVGTNVSPVDFTAENQSGATVVKTALLPEVPADDSNKRQGALECFSLLSKEQIAHVWLADYRESEGSTNRPKQHYARDTLDVYWGNPEATTDKAALELTLIYYDGSQYKSSKKYLDQLGASRDINKVKNFTPVSCSGVNKIGTIDYSCKYILTNLPTSPSILMMLTARLLFNDTPQPFTVQAVGTCGKSCSIPAQAQIFISTGTAGQTQRRIKLCQIQKVAPPYFDYGIFSVGEINK